MTYFCFIHSRPARLPHMEPLDAETIDEAKAQASVLMRQHTDAVAARIYLDANEVAVLEANGRAA